MHELGRESDKAHQSLLVVDTEDVAFPYTPSDSLPNSHKRFLCLYIEFLKKPWSHCRLVQMHACSGVHTPVYAFK